MPTAYIKISILM